MIDEDAIAQRRSDLLTEIAADRGPQWMCDAIRKIHGITKDRRWPALGDAIEFKDGRIGVVVNFSKGYADVAFLGTANPYTYIVVDEERRGSTSDDWLIRDDL